METALKWHKLRSLDSFEEHFWQMEKVAPRGHVLVATISGEADEDQWRRAFGTIQQRHSFLNVSIGKEPGERPFFHRVANRRLPLEFRPLSEDQSLERFAEAELLRSFGAGEGPLTRITVFRGNGRSAVVINSHHAVADGRAHLYILQEALTFLAEGEVHVASPDVPASTSGLLGREALPYIGRSALNEGEPPQVDVHPGSPIKILRSKINAGDLAIIRAACRANLVSFHSALLVALAEVMAASNPGHENEGVRALTPVDVRSKLGVGETVGMYLVLHRFVVDPSATFWSEVARLSGSLKPDGIDEAANAFFTLAEYLVREEHSPISHIAMIAGTEFVHDLMVTNYGALDWRGVGTFRIEDMFTAGIAGHFETQKISAVTLDGDLHLTLVGQSPVSDLMERANEVLLQASKG
jgi:hypothetical protein